MKGPEARVNMRSFLVALAGLMLFATGAAQAKIAITVDKDNQMMTVAVDGVDALSLAGLDRQSVARDAERQLPYLPDGGGPLLQGIRRRADAAFDLLHQGRSRHSRHGVRGPARHPGVPWLRAAVARQRLDAVCAGGRARRAQHHRDADRFVADRAGAQSARPRQYRRRAPRPGRCRYAQQYQRRRRSRRADAAAAGAGPPQSSPQERPDDGYIYPADGSQDGARYPAPRSSRRLYDAQAYPQPQQYYGNAPQYGAPQVYAPRPTYQPRGLFTYQD